MNARFSLALLLALAACPDVRRPGSKDFVAQGSVYIGGVERRGDALAGATVRAWPEGNVAAQVQTSSDDTGFWQLSLPVEANTRFIVVVSLDGYAPASRAMSAAPYTQISWPLTLEPLEPFDCSGTQCLISSDGVRLDLPPTDATGAARAFDPTTELGAMTGLETLRPAVAAFVSLDGGATDGGTPSRLELRLPFSSWKRVDDLHPSTGKIEVPLRSFDESTGRWTPAGEAVLTAESGLELPESALPTLRTGDLRSGALAAFDLPHGGWWAVAWPAASFGCVQGTVKVEGAVAPGIATRVGNAEASASLASGAFCTAAPLGANGTTGLLTFQYAGVSYAAAEVTLPETGGKCGDPTCRDVGTLAIAAADTLTAKVCHVTGTVTDPAGAKLPGAVVVGVDEDLPRGTFTSICGTAGARCALATTADERAQFALVLPVQVGVELAAHALVENPLGDSVRDGALRVSGCPSQPVELVLRSGRDQLPVEISVTSSQVSWTPNLPAAQVTATDADGGTVWTLSSPSGLSTPLTTPSGPPVGGEVEVLLIGTDARGYQYSGGASVPVP